MKSSWWILIGLSLAGLSAAVAMYLQIDDRNSGSQNRIASGAKTKNILSSEQVTTRVEDSINSLSGEQETENQQSKEAYLKEIAGEISQKNISPKSTPIGEGARNATPGAARQLGENPLDVQNQSTAAVDGNHFPRPYVSPAASVNAD